MILLVCTAGQSVLASSADNYQAGQLELPVKSALVIDSGTGQVLYGKNINQPLPIASMTKLVTVYLTLLAIRQKKINWATRVKPDAEIVRVANNPDFSNVPLKRGHKYSVKQLYQATLIESANGAAMCLAQAVSGSQSAFVRQMRHQLKQWHINDAQIYTVCGLPNKNVGKAAYPGVAKNVENKMSAKDMAIVGQHLLLEFPQVLQTTKLAHLNFVDVGKVTRMTNFNSMLPGLPQNDPAIKIDGLKTGTTDAAGACFIGTAKYKGGRVISVVMGARHRDGTDPARFIQTRALLKHVFANYHPLNFTAGEKLSGQTMMKAKDGQEEQIRLGFKTKTTVWDPLDGKTVTTSLQRKEIEAPITKGQVVNYYQFKSGSRKLPSLDNPSGMQIKAQALQATGKVNFLVRFWRWLFGG
ncbi:D-alanyl-D-alanine carboxypeptidase [Lactobacillus sp. ESL0791]|uniref:D-alanyl-D-alanine carboxypeptidase family protein n=1 Tax=Lactobacillus sp. ESL0791 TaxID=2983234 RepID=UPI0023F7E30E|nr:D-alanyl-D-alanine carboxypeptidase family protein [Lactobacillus sp. ESL0791]MDF7638495.1 D-alanyl-D-alanine carboxypeptidase [Lactobacillus sp. ESL0791]